MLLTLYRLQCFGILPRLIYEQVLKCSIKLISDKRATFVVISLVIQRETLSTFGGILTRLN